MKSALITGVTGQDGSYLAELLLEKGYNVYGLIRRKSNVNYGQVEHLKNDINFIFGDITDSFSLLNAVKKSMPDEVYNLAAQSFVSLSWGEPKNTAEINGVGVLNILEAVKSIKPDAKFYQASTSEMFGKVIEVPQKENTPFYPRSPYGVAKLYGHWITKNFRESYGMFNCSGILFNHESKRRCRDFVTRKITTSVAKVLKGEQSHIELGNIDARRDWGHAKDYVNAMYLILQQDKPDDYVISMGETRTVREFVENAFEFVDIKIKWIGECVDEIGVNSNTGKVLVKINPEFFRPAEVDLLIGDSTKAKNVLKWQPKYNFKGLVSEMMEFDLENTSSTL